MTYRWVSEKELLERARRGWKIDGWLQEQRTMPDLIGATVAAEILGVKPPHIAALRERGRMPDPVPVEGSVNIYVRQEVEELAAELEEDRKERLKRRAEKRAERSKR